MPETLLPGPLLDVQGLSVAFPSARGPVHALQDVDLAVEPGGALALVGESGSGKSTVVLALLGLLGTATVRARRMAFGGVDLMAQAAALRGRRLAVVFQDPASALNPALSVGMQVAEPLRVHAGLPAAAARAEAGALLAEAGLPRPAALLDAYPHQLSGGMKQRVAIAMALAARPEMLLLDEPTTALDVTVEAGILDLLAELRVRRGLSLLLVSHNLGIVDRLCDRAAVLYAGRVVEDGPVSVVLRAPRHPYARGLLAAVPRRDATGPLSPIPGGLPDPRAPDPGCNFRPRCAFAAPGCEAPQALVACEAPEVLAAKVPQAMDTETSRALTANGPAALDTKMPQALNARAPRAPAGAGHAVRCWRAGATAGQGWPAPPPLPPHPPRAGVLLQAEGISRRFGPVQAVDGVSLTVAPGEVLGLVGESGSGKSTLGRLLLRLLRADAGTLRFGVADVPDDPPLAFRRRAAIVLQNPDTALNPRQTVEAILLRPLHHFGLARGAAAREDVARLLRLVRLDPSYAGRYPHQLSGGEKQRVGIARALAGRPDFVVCDEAVSALDVSVQAAVLNLLAELRASLGLALLFISHDIGVIAHVADRVAVMYGGTLMEAGPTAAVLRPPFHPYTEALLSAVPVIGQAASRLHLHGEPGAVQPGPGCRFALRCHRRLGPVCAEQAPPWRSLGPGHGVRCHIPASDLGQPTKGIA